MGLPIQCISHLWLPLFDGLCSVVQGSLRVNRFNPYEGYVGSESVGQDILIAGRTAMNRALEGDIVAVELLPEDQWVRPETLCRIKPMSAILTCYWYPQY